MMALFSRCFDGRWRLVCGGAAKHAELQVNKRGFTSIPRTKVGQNNGCSAQNRTTSRRMDGRCITEGLAETWFHVPTIVSLDGSWSCSESALGSRIGRTKRCMCGRQTTFEKHSHSQFLLNEIRDSKEKFHVTRLSVHRVVSPVPNVQTILGICMTPLATYDASDNVLFPDKTSRKHVSIQGRFP